ncbi:MULTISPECIES: sugar ABC transporter permease [unclassified Rathayibacter]|uniref:carbohydrate ABC transporter permease n=1 Tax=unclassified Rathayibacter TaxID=2609250 RepID=UPI0010531A6D|nr:MULTISPECIES: sugar ABC transporter permease [unclassified Rathayibacter]MCJ1675558.1 sugar ABC transporter permease [Rathayibacter sp. VKM Ac-2929]TCL79503.1 raffinose/stachyose/melibiose transport system permease protein [Rathayibacter sp. PhB192]TCM25228.1 raffinose/stachyose/melibiose transport system permease protein [Rathayibacter sp. PhB179]
MRASGLPWILPALVISGGIIYFCIGYNGYVATLDWNGVSPNPQSVGLDNFARAFADPIFWGTIQHTAVYFVVTFAVQTVLGILFAVLLHSKIRFAVLYKVVIFIPVVLAPAIMAPVFRIMFAGEGPINQLLQAVGLGFLAQPWLAQSSTALGVLMIMQVWQSTGISFILYYSAMSQIDTEIIEAARIDGAGNIRVIWSIIVPGIKGTVVALAMLTAIASLKLFDIPYLVTLGGPNYATEFLGTYIYRQAVPLGDVGYAAALSVLLLILALAMAIILSARGGDKKERNS